MVVALRGALALDLAERSQFKVARVLLLDDWFAGHWVDVEGLLHDTHVAEAGLSERVGHVATHARLPYELRIELLLDRLRDVLQYVVLYSLVKLFLVGHEPRTVRPLIDGYLERLLLHRELMRVDFTVVLALQRLKSVRGELPEARPIRLSLSRGQSLGGAVADLTRWRLAHGQVAMLAQH